MEKLRVFPREERVREFRWPFLECGKSFPRSCDLLFHFMVEVRKRLTQTDARPHQCEVCGKAFRRLALLNKHFLRCQARIRASHRDEHSGD